MGESLRPWQAGGSTQASSSPSPGCPPTASCCLQAAGTTRTPKTKLRSPAGEAPGHPSKFSVKRKRVTARFSAAAVRFL